MELIKIHYPHAYAGRLPYRQRLLVTSRGSRSFHIRVYATRHVYVHLPTPLKFDRFIASLFLRWCFPCLNLASVAGLADKDTKVPNDEKQLYRARTERESSPPLPMAMYRPSFRAMRPVADRCLACTLPFF